MDIEGGSPPQLFLSRGILPDFPLIYITLLSPLVWAPTFDVTLDFGEGGGGVFLGNPPVCQFTPLNSAVFRFHIHQTACVENMTDGAPKGRVLRRCPLFTLGVGLCLYLPSLFL